MRKFLLAATILAPFAVAPAFAGGGSGGGMISGDGNLATTSAGSSATVGSVQGTAAQAKAAGNGGVIVGAVSANHTSVATTAAGQAGPQGSATRTTATQANVGGTVAAGLAVNKDGGRDAGPKASTASVQGNGASGSAGGGQTSMARGGAAATAANMNLGGFVKVEPPQHGGGSR
jgi:hypothetical protein